MTTTKSFFVVFYFFKKRCLILIQEKMRRKTMHLKRNRYTSIFQRETIPVIAWLPLMKKVYSTGKVSVLGEQILTSWMFIVDSVFSIINIFAGRSKLHCVKNSTTDLRACAVCSELSPHLGSSISFYLQQTVPGDVTRARAGADWDTDRKRNIIIVLTSW